tara:strand:+ start:168 stop:794 length:627 start_codon:yes stop_codon:yes gene_type:complete
MSDKFYFEDFIGFYENKFPDRLCDALIEVFTQAENEQSIDIKRQNTLNRSDFTFDLQNYAPGHKITVHCNNLIFNSFYHYADNYSILNQCSFFNPALKLQKTISGGGFHNWHCEHGYFTNDLDKDRLLAWMVYLNDDYEGGETEFNYLSKRVKPKKGTLLMWPTGFTHTHRGGMVVSGKKYILTGWIYFAGIDPSQSPVVSHQDIKPS